MEAQQPSCASAGFMALAQRLPRMHFLCRNLLGQIMGPLKSDLIHRSKHFMGLLKRNMGISPQQGPAASFNWFGDWVGKGMGAILTARGASGSS